MVKNYLKIAFRNLLKHKGYTFINIAGLAIGMACCILILLYVMLGVSFEELLKQGNQALYYLQPLRDIHLHSDLAVEFEPNGNIRYVYIFSVIAVFILLIACINFMNLATARASHRAKEVGIRKVVGSDRRRLVAQFLAESSFMSLLALVLALVLVELLLPQFNRLAEKHLQAFYSGNWALLAALPGLALLVGALAGSYPAFLLSGFKPVSVLKGKWQAGAKASGLRNALVVFQLFGLASFTAEQRTKEIGIRKVMGATVGSVTALLSKDFVKLVVFANVIAGPLAYFAMKRWLEDFAYRMDIGWWIFALAAGLSLLIALLTVSTQALKAALSNPVEALRYE